jgi:hypothetical protein
MSATILIHPLCRVNQGFFKLTEAELSETFSGVRVAIEWPELRVKVAKLLHRIGLLEERNRVLLVFLRHYSLVLA